MNVATCTFLRHRTRLRHIGDLMAVHCDRCGYSFLRQDPPVSAEAGSPRTSVRVHRGALSVPQPA